MCKSLIDNSLFFNFLFINLSNLKHLISFLKIKNSKYILKFAANVYVKIEKYLFFN